MSRTSELRALGFEPAGRYRAGQFDLDPVWKPHEVVYVWTRGADAADILRVGIACGVNGFRNRYASYNRWLAGRFKPDDPTEQKKSQLFRQKLDETCIVWARRVADKATALREEADLRTRLGRVLELDLMTPGWARQELAAWRLGGRPQSSPRSSALSPRDREAPSSGAVAVAPSLKAVFADLDQGLASLELVRSEVRDGWSYKAGNTQICRIDPKNSKGCLRVWVGDADEQSAPDRLRGQFKQRGWLVVWPQDRDLAHDYVLASARRRLPTPHPASGAALS